MSISKPEFEALFFVGDVVSCASGEHSFCVTAIQDDHIRLQPAPLAASEIRLEYGALSGALKTLASDMNPLLPSPLHCLAFEYRKRTDQERHDAAVDAMWQSAAVCQIQ